MTSDEAIRLIDRYLMFYIQTAKPLQRTALAGRAGRRY
jgi:NAD(P)H-nitrite reductase large subunit